jgi:multidrug efflux pump subunit AcrA (membrane-fusion protein)
MSKKFITWFKVFGIFLVFMWVCTIVSRSIYVSNLPFVKTEKPTSKYIEHIVSVDGIVIGGSEVAVNTLSGLRVEKIDVSLGDIVSKGNVLFTIDLVDLQDIIDGKESELVKLQLQLADTNFNNILDEQKKEIAVLWAKEDYESADSDTALAVERAQESVTKAETELAKHLSTTAPYTSDEDREKAWNEYNSWKQSYYDVQDKITEKQREIEELEENLKDITDEINNTNINVSDKNSTDKEDETLTDDNLESDIKNEIKQANTELENLQKELTNLERNPISQPDYTLEETEYDTWQSKKSSLEDALHSAKQSLEDAERARTSTLRQKQRDIASAEVYSNASSSDMIYEIQISDMEKEISALQAIKNSNGKITAPNDGYISSISVSTGSRTTDSPSIILNDMSADCKFSCSITTEQSKYIHLNDTLELTLNGNQKSKVTIDYYTQNSQGGYNITCKLEDVTAQIGTSVTAQRTVQGDLHSLTVPIDAIHEENNATYIYTLNEKSSILGNEYYAEKIKVQISDKNDTYAAIESGVISSDTEVIIYSSKELEQGEVVRNTQ